MANKLTEVYNLLDTMAEDELFAMHEYIRATISTRRKIASAKVRGNFHVGNKVKFPMKNQGIVEGEITHIARSRADVKVGTVYWKVPLSILNNA